MGESQKERVDRELIELLNELRVALPGVQVLSAFLLTVPFSSRFPDLTDGQRTIYFITFLLSLVALTCLMAPSTYHRIRFRDGDKDRMLRTSNRFAIVGTALLALAMGFVALLVGDLLYGVGVAVVVASVLLGFMAWCWFGLPLLRKAEDHARGARS